MDRDSDFTKIKKGKVVQRREFTEEAIQNVLPCVEFANEYKFSTDENKNYILSAKENSNVLCRFCCGVNRQLNVDWKKSQDIKFTTYKPFSFLRCFNIAPCCLASASTSIREDNVGYVNEDYCGCFKPKYTLYDNKYTPYAKISGPTCCFGGMLEGVGDTTFRLEELNGRIITNVINKKKLDGENGGNVLNALLGDSDDYDIIFPENFTTEQKVNVLSAILLLDYQFFEGDKSSLNNGFYICTCYCGGCVIPCTCDTSNGKVGTSSKVNDFDKHIF